MRVAGADQASLTLLGLDPFAEAGFRSYSRSQPEQTTGLGTSLFTVTGAVLVSRQTAQDHGWAKGETVEILVAGQARKVTIIDWLDTPDRLTAQQLRGLLVADIATAQDLLSSWGFLTRIDLILERCGRGPASVENGCPRHWTWSRPRRAPATCKR